MDAWSIPYTDQELDFWEDIAESFGDHIQEVYFPVDKAVIASGRSPQPSQKMNEFLHQARLPKTVLFNPIVLDRPVQEVIPRAIAALEHLRDDFDVHSVVVTNPDLARSIKEALPEFKVGTSILMGISTPMQLMMIQDWVDVIVPDNRILRDLHSLRRLRQAFSGEVRLIVNEGCLPGCLYRGQHFYEMGYGDWFPESLCQPLLEEDPWLRLTGAWILPRHLHYYEEVYDSLKLAGRVTLRDPNTYRAVLKAYIERADMLPCEIGGGPASVTVPITISDEFFETVLKCNKNCHQCNLCRDTYDEAIARLNES
jgi:collagenase-like PrtC family protease